MTGPITFHSEDVIRETDGQHFELIAAMLGKTVVGVFCIDCADLDDEVDSGAIPDRR